MAIDIDPALMLAKIIKEIRAGRLKHQSSYSNEDIADNLERGLHELRHLRGEILQRAHPEEVPATVAPGKPKITDTAMAFKDALAHILKTKEAAYACIFIKRIGHLVGADFYILSYNKDHDEDPEGTDQYGVDYSGGLFFSSSGEEDYYGPEEITEDIQELRFQPCRFDTAWLEYQPQVLLALLKGATLAEARTIDDRDQLLPWLPQT